MAEETYSWTLTAFEQQGNLWIDFGSNAPFRAQQGQVSVYNEPAFPPNLRMIEKYGLGTTRAYLRGTPGCRGDQICTARTLHRPRQTKATFTWSNS